MKKYWSFVLGAWILFVSWALGFGVSRVGATYNPLSAPNNRYGVHILEPSEIEAAAALVNTSGGQWGYITIPIRTDDRDPVKWRQFFIKSGQLKLIPIVRLATFVYKDTWVAPTAYDLVDYANFLSDMPWPTRNRYIVLFNEPNHAKEWGGSVDPGGYATLLIQAKAIFTSRSSEYFLLSAGLDMSAPTNHTSTDALLFWRQMTTAQPAWAKSVDGYSFHAYPNPAFSSSPTSSSRYGLKSYSYELRLLASLGIPAKPVFITETGQLGQAGFFTTAFTSVWTEPTIVAVTPFLLFAGSGDFARFSLLDTNRRPTVSYQDIVRLTKTAGSPLLGTIIIPTPVPQISPNTNSPHASQPLISRLKDLFAPKTDRVLTIGTTRLTVEVADNDSARARGLSGRASLPPDHGMLFTFPAIHRPVFWMHGMLFPLDFVWINRGRVVGTTLGIPPPRDTSDRPVLVQPDLLADWILEAPAGYVADHGIKEGDAVVLSP